VVSTDGQTATLTPSAPLVPSASYAIQATSGIANLSGQTLSYFSSSYFITSQGTATASPTVVMISPPNGASAAPLNARVSAVMSR
jgi:hypothetical protein